MIGIDIVKIERVQKMLQRFKNKALKRYLCDEEIALIRSDATAAGFWAAKEAVAKALGCGIGREFSFFDVKISKTDLGAPQIALKHHIIEKFNIKSAQLSITHDGGFAIAVVVLETTHTNAVEEF